MNWIEVSVPGRKPEYIGKFLLLKEPMPSQLPDSDVFADARAQEFLPPAGSVVKIFSRINANSTRQTCRDVSHWDGERILLVDWTCPDCRASHRYALPETWIAEGKAAFVEAAASEREGACL